MTTEVHGVLPQVVVTGTGVVCSVGDGSTELAEAVVGGRSGIAPIQRFDTREFDVHLGAEVKGWKDPDATATATAEHRLCVGFAHRAALEALAQAAVHVSAAEPHRFGIVFGTNLGNGGRPVHELVVELGRRIGFEGPMLSVCTACSSSTSAIGLARDLLLSGFADVVLAGGSDVLTPEIFSGFHAMGVLSPAPCAPFSTPFGTTLGEGAGFLVLETEEGARARGVDVLATVSGWGISGDGYHETSPDPRGRGVERAIRSALDDAGLTPRDIGYVNAHGSGTQANDPSEWSGIQRGLDGSNGIWVSSSKGALGHAQGAAGALEAIITILMMRRGLVPPTLNFAGARNFAPADPVAGPAPREHAYDHAVSVNSAFGGANAAVVLSRSVPAATRSRGRRGVAILGVGAVTSHGLGVHSWEDSGFGQPRGAVPTFSFQEVDPMIDPRGLDPTSRFLTAAASLSLRDAGIRLSRADQDSAGLVLGSVRPSPASTRAFAESVESHGLLRASASAFARMVLNAPAGFCTKLLGLRGPLTAVTVGSGSGLAAILLAAEFFSTRGDVSVILGAGVDELDSEDGEAEEGAEGAVCVALGASPVGDVTSPAPRIVSWGWAGPGRLDDAVARARAGGAPHTVNVDVDAVFDDAYYASSSSGAWALPSSLAFAHAVLELRRGSIQRALVTSGSGDAMSAAALLEV